MVGALFRKFGEDRLLNKGGDHDETLDPPLERPHWLGIEPNRPEGNFVEAIGQRELNPSHLLLYLIDECCKRLGDLPA